jgi:hypothetical protein
MPQQGAWSLPRAESTDSVLPSLVNAAQQAEVAESQKCPRMHSVASAHFVRQAPPLQRNGLQSLVASQLPLPSQKPAPISRFSMHVPASVPQATVSPG